MASTARFWRKRLGYLLMAALFVFLGYQGATVMRYPYTYTYQKVATQDLQADGGEALTKEEARGVVSVQEADKAPEPLVVLVLSSMPRGGSTLLTELLASVQGSVVVFEPLFVYEKTGCVKSKACVSKYLADVLSCNFKPEFEEWLKRKKLFFHYFSSEARRCLSTSPEKAKAACIKGMNLQQRCEAAPLVIVKVIRSRLSWIQNFLKDSFINLKVIHQTRDPRGSLNAIEGFDWNADPHSRCGELLDDMDYYEKLQPRFPDRVTQVRYETLCRRPVETTQDIMRFLFGNATLPARVRDFVDEHMLGSGKNGGGNMNTIKNSTSEFEAWRYKIAVKHLAEIESVGVCVDAIRRMGHTVFGSYKNCTNPKIPLIPNT